jgi:hypothetical protein
MNSIPTTINMKIEDLIGKGYFPKELPPPFNTKILSTKYPFIKNSLAAVDKKKQPDVLIIRYRK